MKRIERIVERIESGENVGVLSCGEQIAAALLFGMSEWLPSAYKNKADAIDRLGPEWTQLIQNYKEQHPALSAQQAPKKGRSWQSMDYEKRQQVQDVKLSSKNEQLTAAEELFKEAFNVPGLAPRSPEYQRGAMAALIENFAGIEIMKNCPFEFGSTEFDAFSAGVQAGHRKYREYAAKVEPEALKPTKSKDRSQSR